MKLRPAAKAHSASCVRCYAPFSEGTGQVRDVCSRCDYQLQELHHVNEYVLYGKTYYRSCLEGTTFKWLANNGYMGDIKLSSRPTLRGISIVRNDIPTHETPPLEGRPKEEWHNWEQKTYGALNLQPFYPSKGFPPSDEPWTIDEAFKRTMQLSRNLYASRAPVRGQDGRSWADRFPVEIKNPNHPRHVNNLPFEKPSASVTRDGGT